MNQILKTYLFSSCDEVKKFTSGCIFKDHENLRLGVDEFKQLNCMRVVKSSQYFKFALNFFEDSVLSDLFLIQDFDSNFVTGLLVKCHYEKQML